MSDSVPPILASLSGMPTAGGLVIPWVTPRTDDGRHLLGAVRQDRVTRALRERLCGVCGCPLEHRMVLLMRLSDLPRQVTSEPALHPQCAAYTISACPMVAGRRSHYRSSPMKVDPTLASSADAAKRMGAPAEAWFAVWLSSYRLNVLHGNLAASYAEVRPLRIRPINRHLPDVFS